MSVVLDQVVTALKTRVYLRHPEQYDALALWGLGSAFAHDVFRHYPHLVADAASPACGKSVVLYTLNDLVPGCGEVIDLTTPATLSEELIRSHIERRPFYLDEVETQDMRKRGEYSSMVRKAYAYRGNRSRLDPTIRSENARIDNGSNGVFHANLFTPLAMAGVNVEFESQTESRTIRIRLHREHRDKWNYTREFDTSDGTSDISATSELIATIATDARVLEALRTEFKSVRRSLKDENGDWLGTHGRDSEAWEPLFTVAQCAGEKWRARAVKAFRFLMTSGDDETSDVGPRFFKFLGDAISQNHVVIHMAPGAPVRDLDVKEYGLTVDDFGKMQRGGRPFKALFLHIDNDKRIAELRINASSIGGQNFDSLVTRLNSCLRLSSKADGEQSAKTLHSELAQAGLLRSIPIARYVGERKTARAKTYCIDITKQFGFDWPEVIETDESF